MQATEVHAGASLSIVVVLSGLVDAPQTVTDFHYAISYVINGHHVNTVHVDAHIVPPSLTIITPKVEIPVGAAATCPTRLTLATLHNPFNCPIEFQWEAADTDTSMSISPMSGIIRPLETFSCKVL